MCYGKEPWPSCCIRHQRDLLTQLIDGCLHCLPHAESAAESAWTAVTGGNGKQIFGDCWWLDTEGEAVINPALSDQSIQAYLTSSHGRPGGSRPLANYLHTPKSIVGSSEGFRHDMAQVMLFLGTNNNPAAMSASKHA